MCTKCGGSGVLHGTRCQACAGTGIGRHDDVRIELGRTFPARLRAAAQALVAANQDLRGTQSASAPPALMALIDAVDDDDLGAMKAAAIAIADECAAEADDELWRLGVASNDPELHALLKVVGR